MAKVNVGTMVESAEVTKTIGRREDVMALQKVQYKNERARKLRGDFEYKLYWKGE